MIPLSVSGYRLKGAAPKMLVAAAAAVTLVLPSAPALASPATPEEAPGAPGASATWTTGDKDGLGTSVTNGSKVWYTLTGGTMSEVYYPGGSTPNVRELQFAVTDGTTFTQLETDGTTTRKVAMADKTSLTYAQTTTDNAGRWKLTKTYITDPARSSVLVDTQFENLKGGPYQLYTLYDPSLAADSGNDSGQTSGSALVSSDTHNASSPVASALVASTGFSSTSTGYVGSVSDGRADLIAQHKLTTTYPAAGVGNIAQVGKIVTGKGRTHFTLALGFATNGHDALSVAQGSLRVPFLITQSNYQRGWKDYLQGLKPVPARLNPQLATQYRASVMTIKAHEDKTYPGAFIASLTVPWGQSVDATGASGGGQGYHFVWARDEYQQVSSLLAAGDKAAAKRAVNWLFTRQQLPDGHFPQNSQPDGTPDQTNIQLDETAYPIILAWQTGQFDKTFYQQHIAKAADYLVANGPKSPQERWEETGGYSVSTLPDMIAGLTAAANLAAKAGDTSGSAIYQATADTWQRNIEKWLYTTTGNLSDGKYYERINSSGNPDDGASRDFGNGAGVHKENSVVDAGFLELVRLGVKAPNDPYVAHSLAAVDESIKVSTPNGDMWKRYTFDGYGEKADGSPWDGTGIGRPWPLLSGERGEYVLANGGDALSYLQTMASSANDGYMIPEQVWDQTEPTGYGHVFGKGTGSAAPLAWAMAQYVRLAQGIAAGKPVETPSVVANRYATGQDLNVPDLNVTSPSDASVAASRDIQVTGTTTAQVVYIAVNGTKQQLPVTEGAFNATINLPAISNQIVVAAVGTDGGTAQVIRNVQAFGDRVGGIADPAGDDNGPGSYVYPTDGAFNPGSLDLTGFDVYRDGVSIHLVTQTAGAINNPWGGNGMSTQRLNIYVHDPADASTVSTPLLPGTNTNAAGPWTRAIVADGRYQSSRFGLGVYGPDLNKTDAADLLVIPATHQIVVTVPASTFGIVDPAKAGYQVSMYSDAEDGEGIGNVRPVYSQTCWDGGDGCPSFVKGYRLGGGAGNWDGSIPAQDTDTSDSNAIDIISGSAAQSTVMDWTVGSPVTVPYVSLSQ
jgi:glucan 1,4-alpha-glucosidase